MLPTIPQGIAPWWYFFCISAAMLITGISKAGFGGGVGILAIPLMTLVMKPAEMIGIMALVLVATDVLANPHFIGEYDWGLLRWLLPGAVVGVAFGSIILFQLKAMPPQRVDRVLKIMIGSICLAMVALQAARLVGFHIPTLPPHPISSFIISLIGGIASTLSHAAGPIIAVYLLEARVEKRVFVGTSLFYALLINPIKVPTYLWLGYINPATLRNSIWFLPLLPIGTLTGAWMNRHLKPTLFTVIMYVAAAGTAGYMVTKALSAAPPAARPTTSVTAPTTP